MTYKIGPHAIFPSSNVNYWAQRAPVTKALDNTATLGQASGIKIFRHFFANQDLNRDGASIAYEIINALNGFRPDYVELYNEIAQRLGQGLERYVTLHEEAVPILHAAGLKVIGFCFSTGNPEAADYQYIQSRGFGGVDALGIHEYWGNQGFTQWHALRHRNAHAWMGGNHPPFFITECGRDRVEGGNGGWVIDNITAEQYVAELLQYDDLLAQDGYVLGATVFAGGPTGDWVNFNTDGLEQALIRVSPTVTPTSTYSQCLTHLVRDLNPNFFIQMVLWQSARTANGEDPRVWQDFVDHLTRIYAPVPDCIPPEFGDIIGPGPGDACTQARNILASMDPKWITKTCDEIRQHVCCNDGSLFPAPSNIRQNLCGSQVFPAPLCGGGNALQITMHADKAIIGNGESVHFTIDSVDSRCSIGQNCTGYLVYGDGTPNDMNPDHVYNLNPNSLPTVVHAYAHIDIPGVGSGDSNIIDITVQPTVTCPTISILVDKTSIRSGESVRFTAVVAGCSIGVDCTGYIIYGDGTPNGMNPDHVYVSPSPQVFYAHAHLDGPGGCGVDSNQIAITVEPVRIPAAPSNLTATPLSQTEVHLNWTRNSTNELGFLIFGAIQGQTPTQIAMADAGQNDYTIQGLLPATTYVFAVSAYNGAGISAFTPLAVVTTPSYPPPPPPPPELAVTLSVSNPNPAIGETIKLTANVSVGTASIAAFDWSFGDGVHDTTGFGEIHYAYALAGTLAATVTVTDERGDTATSAPVSIVVSEAVPAPGGTVPVGLIMVLGVAAAALLIKASKKRQVA